MDQDEVILSKLDQEAENDGWSPQMQDNRQEDNLPKDEVLEQAREEEVQVATMIEHSSMPPEAVAQAEQQHNQQQQQQLTTHIFQLNQDRLNCARNGRYHEAEVRLSGIQEIRQRAETGLKLSLSQKHEREGITVEEQNRIEFEKFTGAWNSHMNTISIKVEQQKQELKVQHQSQMMDLEAYLDKTLVLNVKPTTDILNLKKIEEHMWKQKNYTEAKRVAQTVKELEGKNNVKFMKERNEKIRVQMNHLHFKHNQEQKVMNTKLQALVDEVDRQRKKEQDALLKKLLNIKCHLENSQLTESSKLESALRKKNFACTIVGKQVGSMFSGYCQL